MSQKLTVPHPRKKIDKTTLIVLCVIGVVLLIGCVVLGAAFDYAIGADGSIDGSKISPALHYVLSHPAVIISAITNKGGYAPKMLFVGVCVIGIFALYKYSEEPKRLHRRGTEHGSAKWADEKEVRAHAEKEKSRISWRCGMKTAGISTTTRANSSALRLITTSCWQRKYTSP